ncbi:MAG: hypothetical protein CVU18_06970 [Betaproteobacteria bacterium HGW-Betaproteobacteria-12]|nr:MAG: hypothetical protein CVU18_06970 [Betaproteobacteria bacterium HGW-Betaproteobacteria-12]
MRHLLIALWMLFLSASSAFAQVSVSINVSLFPELVRVPGYPVYYAPRLGTNFFFYDGLYWVYEGDNWYASSWYNGPWRLVFPDYVPLFVLRIPVRYYVSPPPYFRHWRADGPPRWGQHWGRDWERQRRGWDRWDRKAAPAPAPLPTYQRKYSGDRYPEADRQQALHSQNYRYRPREANVRRQIQEPAAQRAPTPRRESAPALRDERRQRGEDDFRRSPANAEPPRQRGPVAQEPMLRQQAPAQRERPSPDARQENSRPAPGAPQESRRGQEKERERDKGQGRGQERGQEHNR